MRSELTARKNKLKVELNENQKTRRIATSKGQNLQNLENTKKEMKKLKMN